MQAITHALSIAFAMGWEILWALILGFLLSAIVQALVRKSTIARLLPDDSAKTLAIATALGAASSSCSYAAVALARSLFRKGANFTAAVAFEIASTNLVIELGIIMAILLGWQFTLAEFIGGPIMIIILAVIFRLTLRKDLLKAAFEQADKGIKGKMEGHAAMDMSVKSTSSIWRKMFSKDGYTSISEYFVMDWGAVWKDIVGGLLIAGAIAAWVPQEWFAKFFFTSHPFFSKLWGPIVGPFISVISFVCSIGNVPLAAVLWNSGISFGGVISFIFADLIIIPILLIYKKYYGTKMAIYKFITFYIAMTLAGYAVEILFAILHLTPTVRNATIVETSISWNYTSILNIVFLLIAAGLVIRFLRVGGARMYKMMS
jgi:uncharacterized membrane protein YraQ (UPF0718 family)